MSKIDGIGYKFLAVLAILVIIAGIVLILATPMRARATVLSQCSVTEFTRNRVEIRWVVPAEDGINYFATFRLDSDAGQTVITSTDYLWWYGDNHVVFMWLWSFPFDSQNWTLSGLTCHAELESGVVKHLDGHGDWHLRQMWMPGVRK